MGRLDPLRVIENIVWTCVVLCLIGLTIISVAYWCDLTATLICGALSAISLLGYDAINKED